MGQFNYVIKKGEYKSLLELPELTTRTEALPLFQMTGRYEMYADKLAEAVKPHFVPNIIRE